MATLEEMLKAREDFRKRTEELEAQRRFYESQYTQNKSMGSENYVAPEGVFDYVSPENNPERIARIRRHQALMESLMPDNGKVELAKFLPPNSIGVGNTPPAQSYSADVQSAGGLLDRFTSGYGMEGIKPTISSVINNAQSNLNQTESQSQDWMPQVNQSEYLKYKAVIDDAARKYNIDPQLLSKLLYAESRFDPEVISGKRTSPKGAIGIAQFMPNTASSVAEVGKVDPRNPVSSIYGAAHYLDNLYKQFGNWRDTVAAYNFGRGNVASGRELPDETKKYLNQIFGDNVVSNNQQQTVVDRGNYITRDDVIKNEIARQQFTEQKQDQPQSQNASILNSVVPFINTLSEKISEKRGIGSAVRNDFQGQTTPVETANYPLVDQMPVTSTETFTDRVKGPEDGQQIVNALQDQEVKQPGFIKRFLQENPNLFPYAAIAFNTLRYKPDDALTASMMKTIEANNVFRKANRTADYYDSLGTPAGIQAANYIRSGGDVSQANEIYKAEQSKAGASFVMDPTLKSLVSSGALTTKEALTLQYKNPTQLDQILAMMGTEEGIKNLDRLRSLGYFQSAGDLASQKGQLDFAYGVLKDERAVFRDAASTAKSNIDAVRRIKPLLADVKNYGSPIFTQRLIQISKYAESLGIDTGMWEDIKTADQLTSALNQLVLEQLRLNKGPQTDFDAIFASTTLPSLEKGQETNNKILNYLESTSEWTLLRDKYLQKAMRSALKDPTAALGQSFAIQQYFNEVPGMMTLPDGRTQTFAEFQSIMRTNFKGQANDEAILWAWKKQEAEIRGENPKDVLNPLEEMGLAK